LIRSSGQGLECLAEQSADLIFAVDTFPYLVLSGLARHHLAEAARVLRPGGALLILNYSYRADDGLDRAEIAACAPTCRFQVARNGTRDFTTWDGLTFLLRKTWSDRRPSPRQACRAA
jgi:SAM-dependent methyltransferase